MEIDHRLYGLSDSHIGAMTRITHYIVPRMLTLILAFLVAGQADAQDLEPRAYADVPTGLNVLALTFSLSDGGVISPSSAPIQDLSITGYTPAVIYVRTLGVFGKLAKVTAVVPFTHLDGSAVFAGQDTTGTRTGFMDARLKLSINLLGATAKSPGEYRPKPKETVLGVSVITSVPVGEYIDSKIINAGSNRWGFRPEIGLSHRRGRWSVETYAGVWVFTDNASFMETSTLEQDPLFSFQGHVSYTLKSGIWMALNNVYFTGGETSLDGQAKKDVQKNWRLGATLAVPFKRRHTVKVLFHTGVATQVGSDFDIVTVAYQYAWF
jgi:hypothetical protein